MDTLSQTSPSQQMHSGAAVRVEFADLGPDFQNFLILS